MASVAAAPLPYPTGPAVQEALAIPQPVSAADKRVSQASACSGTSTNSDGKRKMQVGPWKLGRTLGRGSSGVYQTGKDANLRPCETCQECQYRTNGRRENRAKIAHTNSQEEGRRKG